jgi:two-component system, NtrC family, response regulator AtoC
MSETRILVVDDEYLIRWTLQKNLEKAGYEVLLAETGEEAMQKIREDGPDLALIDINLPGMSGFEVLEKALQIDKSFIPIMITAFEDVDRVVRAMKLGAFDYITKPFDFNKVQLSIEKAREEYRRKWEVRHQKHYGLSHRMHSEDHRLKWEAKNLLPRSEVRHLRQEWKGRPGFTNIIGESVEMGKILEMTEKVAKTDAATVLIQGESGTGKEMIAQAVHDLSKRSEMSFVALNCAGVSEHLLENELCGHEKGAYTDANGLKKGLLELADGGSLFLDEVGDMGQSMQAKILRLIEQKTFRRIGGVKDIHVDVRIISATNKDLKKMIVEGNFREDLFYRLNIVALRIPALRERRDDIMPLAKHFVDKYNRDFHKMVSKISPEVEHFFMAYNWPGNVRELKNVIERAMILGEGDSLLLEHLPMEIVGGNQEQIMTGFNLPPGGISMEKLEESLVKRALIIACGNQTKAARLLGMSRDSLRYRMQKFGIESPPLKK